MFQKILQNFNNSSKTQMKEMKIAIFFLEVANSPQNIKVLP